MFKALRFVHSTLFVVFRYLRADKIASYHFTRVVRLNAKIFLDGDGSF